MSRPQTIRTLRSIGLTVVTAAGLGIAGMSAVAASPEDEIARLDRIRANLFEELVKTRAEAATVRSERDAALKERDAAEAELARLKQESAAAKPVNPAPSVQSNIVPEKRTA